MKGRSMRDGDAASMRDRVGGRIFLVLFAALIGLAATGAGGVFLLKPAKAHTGRGSHEPLAAVYAPLPPMNFTLSDGARLRELRVRVVLEMDPLTEAKLVESYGSRIASAMNTLMLDVEPADLRGPSGSIFIKDAVMQTARKELRPMKVRQVLVQELLLR